MGAQSGDLRIWTIGRDVGQSALVVRDERLSRCHAAVCYDSTNGFILYDNTSTNGSYVNGVRIRRSHMLQDGDRVRLASLKFGFFRSSEYRRAKSPSAELLQHIEEGIAPPTLPIETDPDAQSADLDWGANVSEETLYFLHQTPGEGTHDFGN
ncbi:MAG: FHA domain-containing protein [Leptolyngbya sp. RL_3_1]|nr:FHA domain-containing protein [Leptolyngbya sp. RL_3_1]